MELSPLPSTPPPCRHWRHRHQQQVPIVTANACCSRPSWLPRGGCLNSLSKSSRQRSIITAIEQAADLSFSTWHFHLTSLVHQCLHVQSLWRLPEQTTAISSTKNCYIGRLSKTFGFDYQTNQFEAAGRKASYPTPFKSQVASEDEDRCTKKYWQAKEAIAKASEKGIDPQQYAPHWNPKSYIWWTKKRHWLFGRWHESSRQ